MDLQQKWKRIGDSSRKELETVKKVKSRCAKESERRETIYFRQLREEEASKGSSEERNTEDTTQLPDLTTKRKKILASEEQVLLQTLTNSIVKKADAPDDPDRHFLLSLLPHFKSLPLNAKQEVKKEFVSILNRYRHLALVSQ